MDEKEKLKMWKELRSLKSIGWQKCKEALEATNYDLDLAIKWLRKKGNLKNLELSNEKKFGIVKIGQKEKKIVAFTFNCQTDFVALNEKFQEIAQIIENILLNRFSDFYQVSSLQLPNEVNNLIDESSLAMGEKISLNNCYFSLQKPQENFGFYIHHNKQIGGLVLTQGGDEKIAYQLALQLVANKPHFLSLEEIPQDKLAKIKEKFASETTEENPNKPQEIIQKITQGKMQKYLQSVCFLEQSDFRDPEVKIKDYLAQNKVKINVFHLLSLES